MPPWNNRFLGAVACLAGIVIAALWAAGSIGWQLHTALGIVLALALTAMLFLFWPVP